MADVFPQKSTHQRIYSSAKHACSLVWASPTYVEHLFWQPTRKHTSACHLEKKFENCPCWCLILQSIISRGLADSVVESMVPNYNISASLTYYYSAAAHQLKEVEASRFSWEVVGTEETAARKNFCIFSCNFYMWFFNWLGVATVELQKLREFYPCKYIFVLSCNFSLLLYDALNFGYCAKIGTRCVWWSSKTSVGVFFVEVNFTF